LRVQALLYPLAAVPAIGLLEGSGVPLLGSVVIAGIGMAPGNSWPDLLLLTLLYGLAYSLGSLAQYGAGRLLGPMALAWLPEQRRTAIEGLLQRFGPAAVLWTRPFAIGNYVSLPAGMVRMPLGYFLAFTFLGVSPWILGTLKLGSWLGGRLGALTAAAPYVTALALGTSLLLLAAGGLRAVWRRRHPA